MVEQDYMNNKKLKNKTKNFIPIGYKKTEVGIIPEDWDVKNLHEICYKIIDGTHFTPKYASAGVPFYSVENITSNDFENAKFISLEEHNRLIKRCNPSRGDILMTRITAGILGDTKLIDWDVYASIYVSLALLKVKDGISTDYLYCYTKTDKFRQHVSDFGLVNATPKKINLQAIGFVPIPLPSNIHEQNAIARVISDMNKFIAILEKLISKKKAIKTATMQQILTGRVRLSPFVKRSDGTVKGYKSSEFGEIPEDWSVTTIKEITKNIIDYRGRTPKKLGMDWGRGNILALSAGNVKKGFIDVKAESYFGSYELYKKWMVSGESQKDDIVFTTEAPLGNAALIPNNEKYILSQRTILLKIKRDKYDPKLIIQIFLSKNFQEYISNSATGSTAQGIKRSVFEKLAVLLPECIQEQAAIANILSDMDAELATLEQKLTKARDIKKGMMQQLLTGRIRLPLDHQP